MSKRVVVVSWGARREGRWLRIYSSARAACVRSLCSDLSIADSSGNQESGVHSSFVLPCMLERLTAQTSASDGKLTYRGSIG